MISIFRFPSTLHMKVLALYSLSLFRLNLPVYKYHPITTAVPIPLVWPYSSL